MAQYLIDRIEAIDKQLERARWRHNVTGEQTEKPIRHVFLFIARIQQQPGSRTAGGFGRQEFHLTSSDVPSDVPRSNRRSGRPLPLETSVRGVFAVGICAQDRSSEWARASAKGPP
jgi:thioredoxin reductase (NADPH)